MGWDGPLLPKVAERLLPRGRGPGVIDLGAMLVLLPGRRACRRFLEILVMRAEALGRPLVPPRLIPAGAVGGVVLGNAARAGEMAQRLAWIEAMRATPVEELTKLVNPKLLEG